MTARAYQGFLEMLWTRMVEMVGVHTVSVLGQRALWLTSQKYSEGRAVRVTDAGIDVTGLQEVAAPGRQQEVIEELIGSLVDILTRLLGEDMARRLAADIDVVIREEPVDEAH